jgi:hypothetical protein
VTSAAPNPPASDTQAPSAPSGLAFVDITSTSFRMTWTPSTDNTGVTAYLLDISVRSDFTVLLSSGGPFALGTEDQTTVAALTPETLYYVRLSARDAAANVSAKSLPATVLTSAAPVPDPVLSEVRASDVDRDSVTIVWKTNVPCTSRVEYGRTTRYGRFTPVGNALVTEHSVTITGLFRRTGYQFRAISANSAGVDARSNNLYFRTTRWAQIPGMEETPLLFTPFPPDGINDTAVFGPGVVSAIIRSLNGNEVFRADGDGAAAVAWSGRDLSGRPVESGAYVVTLTDEENETTSRVIVLAN